MQQFDKNRTEEAAEERGRGQKCGDNRQYGDKLCCTEKWAQTQGVYTKPQEKANANGISTMRETGTRGKREVEEVEDVQLHVRGSSKVGKSCTKQSSKLQPSDIVQCKDPAFFQGCALQERERRMLRTILTGCSQASSRTVSDLRYIGLI